MSVCRCTPEDVHNYGPCDETCDALARVDWSYPDPEEDMPLFECTKCHCVENTALSGYWEDELSAHETGGKFEPVCSECGSGKWHGKFPKRPLAETAYVQKGKFLHHPDWDR